MIGLVTQCLNPDFQFPGVAEPGLPNFVLATLLSTLGGITFVLDFLPPDPFNLPSPPSLSLFFKPFTGSMSLDFPLPPTQDPSKMALPPGFPAVGIINLSLTAVFTVFGLFLGIITSILDLSPKLPSIGLFIKTFTSTGEGFGVPSQSLELLGGCLAKAVIGLITSLLPI